MTQIRIVTDSTADLPQDLVQQYQIKVIPLTVFVEGKAYRDRIDIDNETFFAKLKDADELPTTSQPSPVEFVKAYEELADEGAEHIISIHLSRELSGTVQGATLAKNMVADQVDVTVFDSRCATIAMARIVLSVARAIEAGQSIEEILALTETIIKNMDLFFLLDSLDNLQKGGRIGKASFLVGSLLNIKPILRLKDGVIHAYEKVRGNKENKALERMIDVIVEQVDPNKKLYCTVGYCDNIELARYMVSRIRDRIDCDEYVYMQIGSVVATHIGMGAVGLAFYQL